MATKGNDHEAAPVPGKQTVLIVDDDTDSREAMADLLEAEGYQSSQAGNGRQAIAQLEASVRGPGLILLDLDMPVMNGREFLTRMQRLQPETKVPAVIVITGQDPRSVPGAAAVLRKPISVAQLLGLMEQLLRDFREPSGVRA